MSLSAPEYVLALHEPADSVPVLLRNRARGQTLQRIASAETIASPEFQRWLTDQNRAGSDIFIGMNPLKDGASNRTKDNIKEVRHIYLDLDDDATAALANIRDSLDAPPPNFVLDTSPSRHQVVWKIEGVDVEQAESLLHSLANQFGGDSAATDATRVLRMPGFINRKYPNELEFLVQVHHESNRIHQLRDFTIREDSPDTGRHIEDTHGPQRTIPRGHRSQSEADWAYAKRARARGDDPEEVIRRIADYRANDKHDPDYYARLTVQKARIELDQQHTLSQTADSAPSNSLKAPERSP
jgi:RepB DNA-primase from phage plasmid